MFPVLFFVIVATSVVADFKAKYAPFGAALSAWQTTVTYNPNPERK